VMVIRDGEVERLIPFVTGPIVQQVDAQNRTIVCDWLAEYG
jgi:16S rRNA processing protein RimM